MTRAIDNRPRAPGGRLDASPARPLPTSATFLRPSRATGTAIARPGQIVHGLFEQIAGGLGGPSCLERFGRLQNGAGGLRGSAVSEGCLDASSIASESLAPARVTRPRHTRALCACQS